MTPATLTALKGSIAKWEGIVAGTHVDNGTLDCPLCQMFIKSSEHKGVCEGCPVSAHTGVYGCRETPYDEFMEIDEDRDPNNDTPIDPANPDHAPALAAARRMLAFLKDLLPEEPLSAHDQALINAAWLQHKAAVPESSHD